MDYLLRRAILNLGIFFLRLLYKSIARLKIGARKIPRRKATIAQGIVYYTFQFVKFMSVNQRISLCGHQLYYPSPTPAIIVLEGEYEVGTTKLFRPLLREGMTVIDVGSNAGYFTLLAAKLVGSSGRVFSFEPEPRNFKFLLKNVELNGYHNVVCVQKAVSNRSGEMTLFLNDEIGSHTLYGSSGDPSITVETTTLDDFLERERERENLRST